MTPARARPACPRCGYDQSGVIDSWKEHCPLTGTCSECGLELDWAQALRPELRPPVRGYYEHAPHWWNLRSAWHTWFWCLVPWRFAARVTIGHRARPARAVIWLIAMLGVLHLTASAFRLGQDMAGEFPWRPYAREVFDALEPVGFRWGWNSPPAIRWMAESVPLYMWALGVVSVTFPVMLLLLAASRSAANIRSIHIVRFSMYGLAWVHVPFVVAMVQAGIDFARRVFDFMPLRRRPYLIWDLYHRVMLDHQVLWASLLGGWVLVWWWVVIVRMMSLSRGRTVWLMCLLISLLAVLLAGNVYLHVRAYRPDLRWASIHHPPPAGAHSRPLAGGFLASPPRPVPLSSPHGQRPHLDRRLDPAPRA